MKGSIEEPQNKGRLPSLNKEGREDEQSRIDIISSIVSKITKQLSLGKADGCNRISAETLKSLEKKQG